MKETVYLVYRYEGLCEYYAYEESDSNYSNDELIKCFKNEQDALDYINKQPWKLIEVEEENGYSREEWCHYYIVTIPIE